MKALEFTLTVSRCMGCLKCPQDRLAAAYNDAVTVMNMSSFMVILGKLPLDCTVDFSGFSEPMLHPLAVEMMRRASDTGRNVRLFTTLSGFSKLDVEPCTRAVFSQVRLHAPDAKEFRMNASLWIERFKFFCDTGHDFSVMAMSDSVDRSIVDNVAKSGRVIEYPTMLSRASSLWQVQSTFQNVGCSMNRWHQNVVLPNGDVVGCCMSYNLQPLLGNLLTQTYDEIYAAAEQWKKSLHTNDGCSVCEWRSVQ
jgi:radical SAM protein with 4Fe4S-binding SPASM domain